MGGDGGGVGLERSDEGSVLSLMGCLFCCFAFAVFLHTCHLS